MRVWITREKGDADHRTEIGVWDQKPSDLDSIISTRYSECMTYDDGKYSYNAIVSFYDVREFKHMFGFTPKKGSCVEYNFSISIEPVHGYIPEKEIDEKIESRYQILDL